MMACLLYVALILAMVGHSSGAWCVCKQGVSDTMLQRTLDYACGAGADCNPLKSTGVCFNPNNVRSHCNYAVNSYFQKKGQTPGSCDFSGTAMVSSSDPSYSGCTYPASASSSSSGSTPGMTTPVTTLPGTTGTPSTTTTTTTPVGGSGGGSSPFMSTPNGVLGPSGTGSNTDFSHGERLRIQQTMAFSFLILFGLLWVV